MSHEPDHTVFLGALRATLALERSCWIDSFSRLEVAVRQAADRLGAEKPSCDMLAVRLRGLKELKASPQLSRTTISNLRKAVERAEALSKVRASLVHSAMVVARTETGSVALFQNGLHAIQDIPTYTVMSQHQFERSRGEIDTLIADVEALRLNPSSPPQPAKA